MRGSSGTVSCSALHLHIVTNQKAPAPGLSQPARCGHVVNCADIQSEERAPEALPSGMPAHDRGSGGSGPARSSARRVCEFGNTGISGGDHLRIPGEHIAAAAALRNQVLAHLMQAAARMVMGHRVAGGGTGRTRTATLRQKCCGRLPAALRHQETGSRAAVLRENGLEGSGLRCQTRHRR